MSTTSTTEHEVTTGLHAAVQETVRETYGDTLSVIGYVTIAIAADSSSGIGGERYAVLSSHPDAEPTARLLEMGARIVRAE
ncbi:hypothetical protein [Pseudomonas sp.]|uniref:hypothetical protein n=1 Tax=Pseudomonas sp. TaxID=306 RepID=UPI00260C81FE|nr:hypothetical protein [Pseudomonas sp.]